MKIYFKTRTLMRNSKINGKVIDCGIDAKPGRRWAIEVPLKSPKRIFR